MIEFFIFLTGEVLYLMKFVVAATYFGLVPFLFSYKALRIGDPAELKFLLENQKFDRIVQSLRLEMRHSPCFIDNSMNSI